MSFSVWLTGPDPRAVEAIADAIARRLSVREVPVEVLDLRSPGVDALAGEGIECRAAFVAEALARHGIATVVALPVPTRAARARARAAVAHMIEVHVCTADFPSERYEVPDRPEVEIADEAGVERVLGTLEVLGMLARGTDRSYTEDEEREVIRRLKAFGYL